MQETVLVCTRRLLLIVLETEKERDAAEKAVEELKRQVQPKRTHTDDDAGDAHDRRI
jgi:hypothetical protein